MSLRSEKEIRKKFLECFEIHLDESKIMTDIKYNRSYQSLRTLMWVLRERDEL